MPLLQLTNASSPKICSGVVLTGGHGRQAAFGRHIPRVPDGSLQTYHKLPRDNVKTVWVCEPTSGLWGNTVCTE